LASDLGAPSVSIFTRYAFTEMQGGLVRCSETAAPLSICPDLYHLEVVDPNNGRRLSGGEPGMLAVTHLPGGPCCCALLVGDIVSAMPHLQALRKRVITTPRRIGNLIKCLGMLVNTEIIHGVLAAIEGVGEFQIVFMRGQKMAAWIIWLFGLSASRVRKTP
jgi:phenylacetate-coenzyme A ligase PaaK-like adenylate-forming protein